MVLRGQIDEELEQKFREIAMKKFGYRKGSLTKALEEAVARWISAFEDQQFTFEQDPVEAIDGLLSHLDVDSVKLQHEIPKAWRGKSLKDVSG